MKKEAKEVFLKEIREFIAIYNDIADSTKLEKEDIYKVFNQFSINYYYGDYENKTTLNNAFCQFLMDNQYAYYDSMISVLIEAGYQEKQPNGKPWPTEKIEQLFGYGMFNAFNKILKDIGYNNGLYSVVSRYSVFRPKEPVTIKF